MYSLEARPPRLARMAGVVGGQTNSELGMRKKKAIGLRIAARIEDRGLRSEVRGRRSEVR